MGRRKRCVLAMACLFTVTPQVGAVQVIPAVDLPAVVPDSVRDQTARSLALGRDTLGWALHPFRGEFHGLGISADGRSYANDLSADGRVVVGSDYDLATGYRGYVWSPATGKVNYNLLPNGSTGQTRATTISADGVYAAGNITAPYDESGFRWSLAGRERISPPEGTNLHMAAISSNGGVTVGTTFRRQEVILQDNDLYFTSDLTDDDGSYSHATRYTRGDVLQEVGRLTGSNGTVYPDSAAVDVTSDGHTVLINGFNPDGHRQPTIESFLWKSEGIAISLAQASSSSSILFGRLPRSTIAHAISADGTTVVGAESDSQEYIQRFRRFRTDFASWDKRAVLWREETGWTYLRSPASSRLRYSPSAATAVSGDGNLALGTYSVSENIPILQTGILPFLYPRLFLWDEQRSMRDLEDVFSLDYGLDLDGWSLTEATGISDDGTTIIGNGINPDGVAEAWRAVLDRNTPDGDFDFDGDVDHHDYQTLKGNLGLDSDDYAVFYADGDLNADGRVDQADSDAFLSRYENRWMGDFNADGLVDLADYTLWRDLDGLFTGGLADSNGDGWANQTDLAAWRTHFGMAVEAINAIRAQAVPEPAALAGLLAGLVAAACHRRRAGRCERSA